MPKGRWHIQYIDYNAPFTQVWGYAYEFKPS